MNAPTVHLVDDDASLLRGLSRMLFASGYPVRIFESAAEFLATHGKIHRGCVVADLEMPEMNGLELQAALARSGNPLPVVFLTGHGEISVCVDAMKNGAQDFLTKPVCLEKLVAAVDRALAQDAAAFERISAKEKLELRFKRLTTRERQVLQHVVAGTIAGDRGKGDTPDSSDGVVAYWSSHLDGAVSEKIVPSGHGSHENPEGIEEARRILKLHLDSR